MFKNLLVLFYCITFTPKCFALAVANVSAELRTIVQNKIRKILLFLRRFVNSAHDGQFCARRILISLLKTCLLCRVHWLDVFLRQCLPGNAWSNQSSIQGRRIQRRLPNLHLRHADFTNITVTRRSRVRRRSCIVPLQPCHALRRGAGSVGSPGCACRTAAAPRMTNGSSRRSVGRRCSVAR